VKGAVGSNPITQTIFLGSTTAICMESVYFAVQRLSRSLSVEDFAFSANSVRRLGKTLLEPSTSGQLRMFENNQLRAGDLQHRRQFHIFQLDPGSIPVASHLFRSSGGARNRGNSAWVLGNTQSKGSQRSNMGFPSSKYFHLRQLGAQLGIRDTGGGQHGSGCWVARTYLCDAAYH